MTTDVITERLTQVKGELNTIDDELARLRPRVQYLDAMAQRCGGAITVLEGLLKDLTPVPVVASNNSQVLAPQGV